MNKALVILGLTATGLASASGYLYRELGNERDRVQALEQQVRSLRTRTVQTNAALPSPFSSASVQPDQAPVAISKTAVRAESRLVRTFTAPVSSVDGATPDHFKLHQQFATQQR